MNQMERQKLLELIVFYTQNTKSCGLVKLFKLLYYTDMLHFRETGRSVTGYTYTALPYGPVPTALYDEIKQSQPDLQAVVSITAPPNGDVPVPTQIVPHKKLGTAHLTRREMRIANQLAEIFRVVNARDISDVSHARNGPWDKARKRGNGTWNVPIDYMDAVNLKIGNGVGLGLEALMEQAAEHEDVRANL